MEHTEEVESDRFTSSMQPIMGVPTKEDLPPVEGGIGDFFQAGERIRQMDEGRHGPGPAATFPPAVVGQCSQHPEAPCVGKLVLCVFHCVLLLGSRCASCALDSLSSARMHRNTFV